MNQKGNREMSRAEVEGCSGVREHRREGRSETERKREAAKIGMTLSLGAVVATGLMKGRGARTLHILSGMALIGFSLWHHNLYQPSGRETRA